MNVPIEDDFEVQVEEEFDSSHVEDTFSRDIGVPNSVMSINSKKLPLNAPITKMKLWEGFHWFWMTSQPVVGVSFKQSEIEVHRLMSQAIKDKKFPLADMEEAGSLDAL